MTASTPPSPQPDTWQPAYAFGTRATLQMERLLDDLGQAYRERNAARRELEQSRHEALMRLALAAEMKDGGNGAHIVRSGYLAEALARHAGATPALARQLRLAAPLHDIGKFGVADAVLGKAGPLTPDERAQLQQHPRLGAELLGHSDAPLLTLAAEIALHHHEHWDGGGYPAGLRGEAIPLAARIVAVVDGFETLTMGNRQQPAIGDAEALATLAAASGSRFDPTLVAVFLQHAEAMIGLRDWVNQAAPGFAAMTAHEE